MNDNNIILQNEEINEFDSCKYEIQKIGSDCYAVKEDGNYWLKQTREGEDTGFVEIFSKSDMEFLVLEERLEGKYGNDTDKVSQEISLHNFLDEIGQLGYSIEASQVEKIISILQSEQKEADYEQDFTEMESFMKEEIEKYCDENGCYKIYFDYNDHISEEFLLKAFNEYAEDNQGFEKFEDYLENKYYEECLFEREGDIADIVIEDAEKKGYEFAAKLEEYFQSFEDGHEAFEKAGYQGITYDFDDLLRQDYHLNIMLATEMEQNCDMGAIPDVFNNMGDISYFEEEFDNALTYLIHQQGYEAAEVVTELGKDESDEKSASSFIRSVAEEISEMPSYSMMELTVSVSGNGYKLLEVMDNIAKREGSIEISKDSSVGLFNEWQGTCSQLAVELEQSAVIPADMVRNVQIEGAGKENNGYTLDDVCGLAGDFWKGEISVANEQPEFVREDISAIMEAFRNIREKQTEMIKNEMELD